MPLQNYANVRSVVVWVCLKTNVVCNTNDKKLMMTTFIGHGEF